MLRVFAPSAKTPPYEKNKDCIMRTKDIIIKSANKAAKIAWRKLRQSSELRLPILLVC
jgi:hypothetical protein